MVKENQPFVTSPLSQLFGLVLWICNDNKTFKGGISMTRNQIEWFKLQEDKLHNRRTESEARSARIATLREQRRHAKAAEAEQQRSNMANEWLKGQANVINANTLAETIRSNQAREAETNRANVAREVETNRYNTAYLQELNRHSSVSEAETQRSNLAREYEAYRSNVANEKIGMYNANVNQQNADTREYEADTNSRRVDAYLFSVLADAMRSGAQTSNLHQDTQLKSAQKEGTEATTRRTETQTFTDVARLGLEAVDEYIRYVGTMTKALSIFK